MTIRVLLADDHEIVRRGLVSLFQDTEIEVVGEASNGEETLRVAAETDVDLVILDVRMPFPDGLNVLGRLKLDRPDLPVLMMSAYSNPTCVARAVALNASGYLPKDIERDKLLELVRRAAAGESVWTRTELRRISGALSTPRLKADVEFPLTQRENEVLLQLALGATNNEIALKLDISLETIKEHVQNILRKIGVSDRTQAAVWAVRKGLA